MMKGLDRYCDYLQGLTPETVGELGKLVAPNVHFKDPFNDVRGAVAMHAIFVDMFEHVQDLGFHIHHRMEDGRAAVIVWTLTGRIMDRDWAVDGASVLKFDDDGRLTEHVDHWDAAAGLYEKMPAIGWVVRRIRKRLEVAV